MSIINNIEKVDIWEYLQNQTKPVVIYGMGDGAQKIMNVCEKKGIKISGVFASDDFARYNQFAGFTVGKLSDIKAQFDDFIILLAFAVFREPGLSKIYSIAKEHELYAPDVPLFGGGLFDRSYLEQNINKFDLVYDLLEDDISKKTLIDILNFKITGKIEYLDSCTYERNEILGDKLKFTNDEYIVDLGAYDGDTIAEFLELCGGSAQSITAFEPDAKNFKKLSAFVEENDICAELHNLAVWSDKEVLHFNGGGGRNSAVNDGGKIEVNANSIDNILGGRKATLIKYDVEGAEMPALKGAKSTILAHKPKLIVSAYHTNSDLFDIALCIKSLVPEYKLYLRHHPYIPAWETNFYATV
ncbi:MAG: FkbM family methyltransferase [Oscillospiraceae bacterium]|nr:FkbM family methyltransferase [Oscillospiraceae bacterium]